MTNINSEYRNLIQFVAADSVAGEQQKEESSLASSSITGEEAKTFYEKLITDDPDSKDTHQNEYVSDDLVIHEKRKHNCMRNTHRNERKKKLKSADLTSDLQSSSRCSFGDSRLGRKEGQFIKPENKGIHICKDELVKKSDCGVAESSVRDIVSLKVPHQNLLIFSQNGELKKLRKLIDNMKGDLDLDFQDTYGWTALMCASVGKHSNIVKFLLSKGANRYVVNSKGQTAADLADEIGAKEICDLVHYFTENPNDSRPCKVTEEFYCDVCKSNFKETTKKEHSSSTVHLFNLKLKPKADLFMIPETNVGFQLMRRSGWDGSRGLGPAGKGQKYPVKTVLKRDRSCLGTSHKNDKAKVTHFGPNDKKAIESVHKHSERIVSARTISRREQNRRAIKNKQWEIELRRNMSLD